MKTKKLEDKIESDYAALAEGRFHELLKDVDLTHLEIPAPFLAIMKMAKQMYQIGYQDGNKDFFAQMKEIYDNDPDLFQQMFEDEIL